MERTAGANKNFFGRALVAVVADDASCLQVDGCAKHGVTNEVKVCELRSCKDKGRLELRTRAEDAVFGDPVAATEVGACCDKTAGAKDERPFQD